MIRIGEEQGKIGRHYCSAIAGSALLWGYETETRHSNARLSIYRMRDVSAFMIKGDTPAFMMEDRM
jgi:hypothetical protein